MGELIFTRAGRVETRHAGWSNNCNAEPKVYINMSGRLYVWSPVAQPVNIAWGCLDECRAFHGAGVNPVYTQVAYSASEFNGTTFNLAAGSNNLVFYPRWNNQAPAVNVVTEFFRASGLRVDWRPCFRT